MAHARKNGHTARSLVTAAAVSVAASAALCKAAATPGIGHNSVQIPHDGVRQTTPGATFGPKTVFRPTTMSLALERAGILPGSHIVSEQARSGLLRHQFDGNNSYHSVAVDL